MSYVLSSGYVKFITMREVKKMLINILVFIFFVNVDGSSINIWTKTKFKNVVVFNHFWKNTGLCPASDPEFRAKFLLSEDEQLNLDYIGALPNEAITSVRIHWLLDLVTVSKPDPNEPEFDFQNLDIIIDRLYQNDLNPSFELMGNPSNYFHNFTAQFEQWSQLIRQVIERYTEKYGPTYLRAWRFELMNEPDLKMYNFFNLTLENYLDYFRASEKAVRSIVGPAGLFRDNTKAHSLCWGLLDYCNSNPCNLEMITFHRKGDGTGSQVVEKGLELINALISKYPNLKGIAFGNDEADIMTGWQKPMEWRGDVRYAALVVQVIIGHIEAMLIKRNIPFEMLSNDNAFLSFSPDYFTQRTLLARFQMNNTSPKHVQFFRKPVYSVMALLSMLGNYLRDIRYHPGEKGFSYLVTNRKYEDFFLGVLTNDKVSNETYSLENAVYTDISVRMSLGNFTFSGVYVVYVLNNIKSNPYKVWSDAGKPDFPNADLRRRMRAAEGLHRLFIRKVKPHQTQIKFILENVPLPSVFAVSVCFEGTEAPGEVIDLRYVKVTLGEIILFWKDTYVDSRCLFTYLVEFKPDNDPKFQRINTDDSIFLSYHHDGVDTNGTKIGVAGQYRVSAIDYWDRRGPYSNILTVSG